MTTRVPVSLLDRSRVRRGEPAGAALNNTVERSIRAEDLGFHRFWMAEHHAVPGIASGSPALLMAAVAARTTRIRVGSGGIMLPNHRPIIIAEQARMLHALYPGRIDLGIGRSLGFTAPVREALGVQRYTPEDFHSDLTELQQFLAGTASVTAMPAEVPSPPLYVLATKSGVQVAAEHGLPVVVGGPALQGDAEPLADYRRHFRASATHPEPHVIVSADVMIADTAAEARELALPEAWAMVESRSTGAFPPLADSPPKFTARQQELVEQHVERTIHGTPADVAERLTDLVERTGASEVLAFSSTFDLGAQAASDTALSGLTLG